MAVRLPNVGSRVVDPASGTISRDWYLALLSLATTVTGALVSSVNIAGNNGITVGGSPITSVGVITLGINNLTCANAQIAGTVTAANVVASVSVQSLNLSATGTATCGAVIVTGTITAANVIASASVQSTNIIASGTITAANVISTGTISSVEMISTGTLTANNVVILGALTFSNSLTNSLGSNVSITNTTGYFGGPSISTGPIGTWYVSGTVSVQDTVGAASFNAQLSDGTTVIASTKVNSPGATTTMMMALSGVIASPAGRLQISVKDNSSANGLILFNDTGLSKDSTISAFRIA